MVPIRSSEQAQAGRPDRGACVHCESAYEQGLIGHLPQDWLARTGSKIKLVMTSGSYADHEGALLN